MLESTDKTPLKTINKQELSDKAVKIILKLKKAGYEAYLVGGCVRDCLLGLKPKDFDIATDAKPEQIKALFSNCRLIGRRFKLAHILFGREIIEVATFRGHHEENTHSSHKRPVDYRDKSGHTKDGLIVRDNVYGTLEEDAIRRDFTINGLYLDVVTNKVIDYVHGQDDLMLRQIKVIGDPELRFAEDPVRMLRAVRFSAKLNFPLNQAEDEKVRQQGHLLAKISPARLFDESLKLLQGGYGVACFKGLLAYDLFKRLFPSVQDLLNDKKYADILSNTICHALENTDQRISIGKSVNPAFLLSVLLWYPMQKVKLKFANNRENSDFDCLLLASNEVVKQQQPYTSIPKRLSMMMKDIWFMQSKLEFPRRKQIEAILSHKRFRAAYDFLELRFKMGALALEKSYLWWTEIQFTDTANQQKMINALPRQGKK